MLSKDQKENLNISSGGDFSPLPSDKYTTMIADVSMVQRFNKFKGQEEDRLNFLFIVLDDKNMESEDGETTTRGRYLWHAMTPSLASRAWLGKLAQATMGRELTKEEKDAFDPEDLVGKQVDVMTEQNESGDTVYTNIISYQKTKKELELVEYDPSKKGDAEKESQSAEDVLEMNELSAEEELAKLKEEMAKKAKT